LIGHQDVHDHEIGRFGPIPLQPLFSIAGFLDIIPRLLQGFPDELANLIFIVNDEY
jgi:hypothetical protein